MEDLEEEIRSTERILLEKEHELKLTEAALREIRSSSQRLERELSSIETEKKHSAEMVETLQKKIAETPKRSQKPKKPQSDAWKNTTGRKNSSMVSVRRSRRHGSSFPAASRKNPTWIP